MASAAIPKHIAIIMDGNGRWAKKKGLPRTLGHKRGIQRVREVIRAARKLGIKAVTVFAFSSENWSRSRAEVETLFSYMRFFLDKYTQELIREGVRVNMIGARTRIDKESLQKIEEIEDKTRFNKRLIFNVALDYGGRWDIVQAAEKMAREYKQGKIDKNAFSEDVFSGYLALGGGSDPDLLIRSSGEKRISNFLLWNLAYSEFYFSDKLWPDFDAQELRSALAAYGRRQRRFGKA